MCDLVKKGHGSTSLGLEWLVLGTCAFKAQGKGFAHLATDSRYGVGFTAGKQGLGLSAFRALGLTVNPGQRGMQQSGSCRFRVFYTRLNIYQYYFGDCNYSIIISPNTLF